MLLLVRRSAVRALLLGLLLALSGCAGGDGRTASGGPVTLDEVHAAAARTIAAGSAKLRATTQGAVIEGIWDFARHEGRFHPAGENAETVVLFGAIFVPIPPSEIAKQALDPPEYRYRWAQRTVPTTDEVADDDYFGLAHEGPATLTEAFDVLQRGISVQDLGPAGDPAVRRARVILPPDFAESDYHPPEVWLDRTGRIRRLRLAATVAPGVLTLDLTLEVGSFGVPVEVKVPPIAELNASADSVPTGPWRMVEEGNGYRVLVAPDNLAFEQPQRRTGRCIAVVPAADDPRTPPSFYDCLPPNSPEYNPLLLARHVHPGFRDRIVAGFTLTESQPVVATFDDGTDTSVGVHDGVFAVVVPDGRSLQAIGGTPVAGLD